MQNENKANQVEYKAPDPQPTIEDKIKEDPKNQKVTVSNFVQLASHPIICWFLVILKSWGFACFVLLTLFVESKSLVYIIVILFGSIDFWITKNIAGRKLVGLRWWNEVKENGEEVWVFESKNEIKESTADKSVFWTCLYIAAGGWLIIFIYEIITLSLTWSIIALVMLVFNGTNWYGYFKCSKDQQGKATTWGGKLAVSAAKKGASEGIKAASST